MRGIRRWPARTLGALAGAALILPAVRSATAPADSGAVIAADADGRDWPSYGRTYSEAHDSPLREINPTTISRLGLVSAVDLGDDPQGATVPLEVDGIIYVTVGQARVRAIDARTGKVLWLHDPEVAKVAGRKLRYAWGEHGIAWWNGKIYVGTMDGRLIALDAKTGKEVWSTVTTMPDDDRYITGAPRAFRGLIIIGHGGADVAPTRGYVTAYDAETGKQKWRFFTVPGDPAKGFENEAMARAAKTWTGEWWKLGGGGTVWNAITYDPELNLVYLGVGNGAPYNRRIRSPGGGDNLYLSSIVALDADTGEYRWHYQETPGESFDATATQDMALATLTIDGKPRKVLMQAPKNGFFYVIDRETGKPISADKFGKVTWADHVDLATGRPVEAKDARDPTAVIWPSSLGAHNWPPMAFSPKTGLAYIPTIEMPGQFDDRALDPKTWHHVEGRWNTGFGMVTGAIPADAGTSFLQAYDPVKQKRVWQVPVPGAWPGGVLSTAGNLVFHGQPDGWFKAYAADTGQELWKFDAGLGITGGAISFAIAGKQYVAVVAGWGGLGAAYYGPLSPFGWQAREKHNYLYVFALDGMMKRPSLAAPHKTVPIDDPKIVLDPAKVEAGGQLFAATCVTCHGAGAYAAGIGPDLRASQIMFNAQAFRAIVHDGALLPRGMPKYGELTDEQLEQLRQFVRSQARATK